MRSRSTPVLVTLAALALLVVGLTVPAAQARTAARVPTVGGLTQAAANNVTARFVVRWRAVSGATYQVRWASSVARLRTAKRYPSRTTSAQSPTLSNVCITWYAQVRAIKRGKVGSWSAARALHFTNRRPTGDGVRASKFAGTGVDHGVKLTWNPVPNATRYRVEWDAAPFGGFTPTVHEYVGGWTSARTATLDLGTTPPAVGDRMMGAEYGNPVYARLIANNACFSNAPYNPWIPVFPKPFDPGTGDPLRFGTYNLELTPTTATALGAARIKAFAENIVANGIQVLALEEASSDTVTGLLDALTTAGQDDWQAAPQQLNSPQQILFRSDHTDNVGYDLVDSGHFGQQNPPSAATPLVTPWARLHPLTTDTDHVHQDILVVAVHLAQDYPGSTTAEKLTNKHNAGLAAQALLDGISTVNATDHLPVISAGDYRYLREPFQDVAGQVEGPPTFIRGGFYDALSAVTKVNVKYTSVNGHVPGPQPAAPAGVATRADYILLQGFGVDGAGGSVKYDNVANTEFPYVDWTGYSGSGGPTPANRATDHHPSDHNLVYADVLVPYAG